MRLTTAELFTLVSKVNIDTASLLVNKYEQAIRLLEECKVLIDKSNVSYNGRIFQTKQIVCYFKAQDKDSAGSLASIKELKKELELARAVKKTA